MPGIMLHFGEIVKKNILGSLFLKHIMKAKNYFNITNLQEFITQHNNKIRAFYKDKPNFLEFDIENDASEKLSAFLNIPITFPHLNKTKCIS
jgi:hypothetical protein